MDPLITADHLAGYLQRDLDRYTADLAVRGASGAIRAFCGWDLSRAVETMAVDWSGGTVIKLPTLKLDQVDAVRIDGDQVDTGRYFGSANGTIIMRTGWAPTGLYKVEADVQHGYDPIPDEIVIVACAIAARMYANPEGLIMRVTGDSTRTFGKTISDLEMRLLSRYVLT